MKLLWLRRLECGAHPLTDGGDPVAEQHVLHGRLCQDLLAAEQVLLRHRWDSCRFIRYYKYYACDAVATALLPPCSADDSGKCGAGDSVASQPALLGLPIAWTISIKMSFGCPFDTLLPVSEQIQQNCFWLNRVALINGRDIISLPGLELARSFRCTTSSRPKMQACLRQGKQQTAKSPHEI